MCVFIAYLLPGVVSRDLQSVWSNVGALASTVIAHMAYEAYFLKTSGRLFVCFFWPTRENHIVWLIPSYIAISIAIILLVLLLSCAVIAGKSIRNIMSQKVPLALSCCSSSSSAKNRLCNNVADHVLKCWIVVRASQPDNIMARSVFCAFAGVVVTVCDVLLIVKWVLLVPLQDLGRKVFVTQFAFVIVGSIVVVFRWLNAVFYFPKNRGYLLQCEAFWTRELVQQKQDLHRCRLILSLLLTMLVWACRLMVSLSKLCWSISEFVFIKVCWSVSQFVVSKVCWFRMGENKSDQFARYEKALEIIRMPGENALSLWRANKWAFENTENNLKEGIESGKSSCEKLISLKNYKTGAPGGEDPTSLEEEKQFKAVGKNSWKMRAVSMIHLIIYFYDGTNWDVVNNCMEAYSQALCFMDMVDRSDPETKLVSEAADNEFKTLEKVWKMRSPENSKRNQLEDEKVSHNLWKKALDDNMNQLVEEERAGGKEDHTSPSVDKLHDSNDLKAVAAKISLYKIWKVTFPNSNAVDAIQNLRRSLANIIFYCLEEEVLDEALLKNCNRWAEDGKEKEIFNAAFITGKAKGVRQQGGTSTQSDAVRAVVEGDEC